MQSQFFCQATASTAIDIRRFSIRAAVKWPAQPFDDAGFIRSWTAPDVFSSLGKKGNYSGGVGRGVKIKP